MTAANVHSVVYPSNPVSKRMLELQSKCSAIDDGLGVVKKTLERDNITVGDALKLYR